MTDFENIVKSYGWKLKKGNHPVVRRTTFQGMKIAIETDKGDVRKWYDSSSGTRGETKMKYPYGYFEGTKDSGLSGDNMALDVYVGPVEDAENVYVVRQMKKPDFKTFDELKVMVGFESEKRARVAYLMHYDDDRFLGEMEKYSLDEFKNKFITPFQKALAGKDVGEVLSSAAGNSPEQFNNPVGVPAAPMAGQPMGMMPPVGPPPIDVETQYGVKQLLGRIGSMKDPELLNVAEEIWGPGYQYINATPEHVRCEILGFLLDQRDLLELATDPALIGGPPPMPPMGMPQQPSLRSPNLNGGVPPVPFGGQSFSPNSDPSLSIGSSPTGSSSSSGGTQPTGSSPFGRTASTLKS